MAIVLSAPSVAAAHPIIDEGIRHAHDAEFAAALSAFARAEAASDLTIGDLVDLYENRAIVHSALGDQRQMESDLTRLATVSPSYEMAELVPPKVRTSFDRIKHSLEGSLDVVVEVAARANGTAFRASVENDPGRLVREVRLGARTGDGAWRSTADDTLVVAHLPGAAIEYYAEAIGPGGAIVLSRGSASAPLVHRDATGSSSASVTSVAAGGTDLSGADDRGILEPDVLLYGGLGVASVLLAIVVIAVVSSSSSEESGHQLAGPRREPG